MVFMQDRNPARARLRVELFMAGNKGLESDAQTVPCVQNRTTLLVAGGCLIALILSLFGPVLFKDRQFAFRDAAQFYYPLYLRVQQDWAAGGWPLWMDEANGGMPLLGNPISAVFYPGKLVYATLPYPWAVRAYVILHVLLAFGAMVALLRSWRVSMTGAAPRRNLLCLCRSSRVSVCQRDLPGRRGLDATRATRHRPMAQATKAIRVDRTCGGLVDAIAGGRSGIGLPCWCFGLLYCVWLCRGRIGPVRWVLLFGILAAFYAVQVWLACRLAWLSPGSTGVEGYRLAVPVIAVIGWGMAIALVVKGKRDLARGLSGLVAAAVLALAMTAVQVWPTLEFASLGARAADTVSQDIYAYSFRPVRIIEWVWPNVSGTLDRGNRPGWKPFPDVTRRTSGYPRSTWGGLPCCWRAGRWLSRTAPLAYPADGAARWACWDPSVNTAAFTVLGSPPELSGSRGRTNRSLTRSHRADRGLTARWRRWILLVLDNGAPGVRFLSLSGKAVDYHEPGSGRSGRHGLG